MKKIQNNEMFAAFLMGSSEVLFSTDSVGNIAGRKFTIHFKTVLYFFHTVPLK